VSYKIRNYVSIYNLIFTLIWQEFNELNPKGLDDVVLRTEYYKKDIVEDIRDLLNAPPLNIKITGKSLV